MKFFKNLFKPKVKVGDNVKCINDTYWHDNYLNVKLVLNKVYKVYSIVTCPKCGHNHYDIGVRTNNPEQFSECVHDNGKNYIFPGRGIYYPTSIRFIKTKEKYLGLFSKEDLQNQLNKALQNEDYNLATKLRDQINEQKEIKK